MILFPTTNEIPGCLRPPRPLRQERYQYSSYHLDAQDLKGLLNSVQSHAIDAEINEVINSLRGKTVHQLIAEGQGRIGSAAPSPAPSKAADKKDAAKKDEKK